MLMSMLVFKLWLQLVMKFIINGGHVIIGPGYELYHVTRWHRVKSKVTFTYHMRVNPSFLDWYYKREYVPLICLSRREIRSIRLDGPDGGLIVTGKYGNDEHGWRTHVKVVGEPGAWCLPPGIERIEDLPRFSSYRKVYSAAEKTPGWEHLRA